MNEYTCTVHVVKYNYLFSPLASGGFPGLLSLWDEERLRRERGGITDHLSPPPSPG